MTELLIEVFSKFWFDDRKTRGAALAALDLLQSFFESYDLDNQQLNSTNNDCYLDTRLALPNFLRI